MARTEKRTTRQERDREDRRLWGEFQRSKEEGTRNTLIERYLPEVRYAAERLVARLPSHVEIDDLIQTGVFGLMDAIERFDLSKGIRFETYCQQRITGSMLDGIRSADWVPRTVRSQAQKLEKTWQAMESELGREPSDFEVAARLGVDLEEYDRLLIESNVASVISYNRVLSGDEGGEGSRKRIDLIEDGTQKGPLEEVERTELFERLSEILTKKERLVIILYYYERFTFREIGEVLELSESRICQVHSKVIVKLKAKLSGVRSDLMG